jgi:pimeloyl-ACP methyl ester carboxylesterase
MWLGKAASGVSVLWGEMLATNLAERVTRLEVPAYFFHGIHDYTVSYQLAKTYVEGLDAPLKGFYTFSKSAHSPIFEEPEKCMRIMRDDVLAGTNSHADSGE